MLFRHHEGFSEVFQRMPYHPSSIPVIGYAIRDVNMCFLDRNWEKDRHNLDTFISNFISAASPISVLLCPEGTTLTQESYERSQRYAKKVDRPCLEVGGRFFDSFQHLLLPRSTGLAYLVKNLVDETKRSGEEFYIYDTMMQFDGYRGEICDSHYHRSKDLGFPTILGTLYGALLRRRIVCHLHVRVVPVSELAEPDSPLEEVVKRVEKWLDDSWVEKEAQMDHFIEHRAFTEDWSNNLVGRGAKG